MARQKITEYRAKNIILKEYKGISLNISNYKDILDSLENKKDSIKYVVKVDQGIKGRYKKGLLHLNVNFSNLEEKIMDLNRKGYTNYLIEEMIPYKSEEERYLSMERIRKGVKIMYSRRGGVDVEEKPELIQNLIIEDFDKENLKDIVEIIGEHLELPIKEHSLILDLIKKFNKYHFSFIELNPLILIDNKIILIDTAVLVDDAGEYFVEGQWSEEDFVSAKQLTKEEIRIKNLHRKSTATLSYTLLNPDGQIFMLLNSGGASIVVSDEVYNRGYGDLIANYGEQSGGPTIDESYIYTLNILKSAIKSKAKNKKILAAGGVANFTDVLKMYKGIVKALDEVKEELQKQKIKVYVRRGGPNEKEGLKYVKDFLLENNLYGSVSNSDNLIIDASLKCIDDIKNNI